MRRPFLKKLLIPLLLIVVICAILFVLVPLLFPAAADKLPWNRGRADYEAPRASKAPVIDGLANDSCWKEARWSDIKYLWLGTDNSTEAKNGRFKIVWTPDKLYYLVESYDENLSDLHSYPFDCYNTDDGIQVFLDEDHSGGGVKCVYNAFKYYINTNNFAASISTAYMPVNLSSNMKVKRTDKKDLHTWEIALNVYNDDYKDYSENNVPVKLFKNKVMGFALATCDEEEGDVVVKGTYDITGKPNNLPGSSADGYGTLKLLP